MLFLNYYEKLRELKLLLFCATMNKILEELRESQNLNTDARNTMGLLLTDLVRQVGED